MWIESHCALARHPKVFRLAANLEINKPAAIGHLHLLWWWAMQYAQEGDLSRFSPAEIAGGAEWPGDPGKLTQALLASGWVDEGMILHDWHEYAGRLLELRRRDAERKRNVRRTSSGHPADVCPTAHVPNLTQPTQPNQQDHTHPPDSSVCVRPRDGNGSGEVPELRDVLELGKVRGIAEGVCREFFDYHQNNAYWFNRFGRLIDWRSKLTSWQQRDRCPDAPSKRAAVSPTAQAILDQTELKRVEAALENIERQASVGAMGPMYSKEEKTERKRLKERRADLLKSLGMQV